MNVSQVIKILSLLMLSGVVTCRSLKPYEDGQTSVKKLAAANNNFGLSLYQKLSENSKENLFFSPLSLSIAFGMLFHGARSDTAKELGSVLGYQTVGLQNDQVHTAFTNLMRQLRSSKGYELSVANGILVDYTLPLNKPFIRDMKSLFKAPIENVNFAASSDRVKNSVNDWVNSKTKGKISNLLEDLSPETVMIILNAVYFKGRWTVPFDEEMTMDQPFYNNGKDEKNVQMMHMTETTFPYSSFPTYSAVELPYDGNVSMVILLPTENDGLPALEASLTPDLMSQTLSSFHPTPVTLSMPKFNLESSSTLNQPLQDLGMQRVFSNGADLSGISRQQGLKVSQVVHKATLSVDEKGSVAAAATVLGVIPYSAQLEQNWFAVDHPFLFAIVDRRSDLIMFMGRVNQL